MELDTDVPFESLAALQEVQQQLGRRGYHCCPVPMEYTEGLITRPSVQRLHALTKRRGFGRIAGHIFLTVSGHADDSREIFHIPVVRAYCRKLDRELPVLPALLGMAPELGYNGSGFSFAGGPAHKTGPPSRWAMIRPCRALSGTTDWPTVRSD